MIISLRGTNGSGKSTIVRELFTKSKSTREIKGRLGTIYPEAYELSLPKVDTSLFVLGPYRSDCGGCDRLHPYDIIIDMLEQYSKRGHVLFEGVIVTSVYGRIGEILERFKKDAVFVFIDTPLEECMRRIEARRGVPRDDRLVKNVRLKFETAQRIKTRVETEKIMRATSTSTEKGAAHILKLLQESKWQSNGTGAKEAVRSSTGRSSAKKSVS